MPTEPLLEILLERGVLTPAQLEQCRADCAAPGGPATVLDALLARGFVDRGELDAFRSRIAEASPDTHAVPRTASDTLLRPILADGDLSRLVARDPAPARRRIGRFEILEELGRGGMGVVYKALDTRLSRTVALKGVHGGVTGLDDPEAGRLLREARTAARLRHPGIIQVHEVDEIDGQGFIVMDFVAGRTLTEHLRRAAPADLREGARIVRDVAAAIAYAHAEGIIHRDLKPDNILVDESNRPLVGDFGLAKEVGKDGVRLTASGAVLGTPAYMSPEQAEGRPCDLRTDVYGLGAVLYEVLCGAPPAEGAGMAEILYRVVHAEPPRPSALQPRVPRDLEVICLKCLEKEPGHRYASAAEVADDLERFLNGEAIRGRPSSRLYRAQRWMVRRKALSVALAGAVILASAALALGVDALRAGQERRRSVVESDFYRRWQVRVVEAIERRRIGEIDTLHRVMEEAVAAAGRQIDADPRSAAAWFVKGWVLRLGGKVDEAEAALTEAVRRKPDDASARYQRGLLRVEAYRLSRDEARRRRIDRVFRANGAEVHAPTDAELESEDPNLAPRHAAAEEDFAALAQLETAGQAGELGEGMVECGRGILALVRGDLDAAEPLLRAALERDGLRDEALDGWIDWIFERRNRNRAKMEDVLAAYDRALQANEGRWTVWVGRAEKRVWKARIDWDLGRLDTARALWAGAEKDLDAAQKLAPREILARTVLAELLVEQSSALIGRGEPIRELAERAIRVAGEALAMDPRSTAAFTERGRAWLHLGDEEARAGKESEPSFRRAAADFNQALACDPQDVPALHNRSVAYLSIGEAEAARGEDALATFGKAIEYASEALRRSQDYLPTWTHRGLGHLRSGQAQAARGIDPRPEYAAALADFGEAIGRNALMVDPHLNRGNTHAAMADFERAHGEDARPSLRLAAADYAEALRLNPELALSRTNLATAYLRLGEEEAARGGDPAPQYERAIGEFGEAEKRNPQDAVLFSNRATAILWLGVAKLARGLDPREDYRRAIAEFEEALHRNPNLGDALNNSATALKRVAELEARMGQDPRESYRQAAARFSRALDLNPAYVEARHNRGVVLKALGDAQVAHGEDPQESYRLALEDFAEVLRRDPEQAHTQLSRANLYLSLGDMEADRKGDPEPNYRQALEALDAALRIHPGLPEALNSRGSACVALGRCEKARGGDDAPWIEKALADFDASIAARPTFWQAPANKGAVLEQRSRLEEAVVAFESALRAYGGANQELQGHLDRVRAKASPWTARFAEGDRAIQGNDYAAAEKSYTAGLTALEALPEPDRRTRLESAPLRLILQSVHYNVACCLARSGKSDSAFEHLRRALEFGYKDFTHMDADADLASLRADPRWPEIRK